VFGEFEYKFTPHYAVFGKAGCGKVIPVKRVNFIRRREGGQGKE
jgi:hypothetical protein